MNSGQWTREIVERASSRSLSLSVSPSLSHIYTLLFKRVRDGEEQAAIHPYLRKIFPF